MISLSRVEIKGWIGYAVSLLGVLTLGFAAYSTFSKQIQSASEVARVEQVLSTLEKIRGTAVDADYAGRGFLLTSQQEFFSRYSELLSSIRTELGNIRVIVGDDPTRLDRVYKLQAKIDTRFSPLTDLLNRRRAGGADPQQDEAVEIPGRAEMDALNATLTTTMSEESQLLQQRKRAYDDSVHTTWVMIALLVAWGAASLTWIFMHTRTLTRLREDAEGRASEMMLHDPLSGLPSRRMLNERLRQVIAAARRHGMKLAVLYLSIPELKRINDRLGRNVADTLVVDIAKRLNVSVRKEDVAGRVGGDEFIIVLTHLNQQSNAAAAAKKVIATIEQPYQIDEHTLTIGANVGIAFFPDNGIDSEELLKNADSALYQARMLGKNSYCFFGEVPSLHRDEPAETGTGSGT